MNDLGFLLPSLLIARVALDLVALSRGGTPYQLDLVYSALFLLVGFVMLSEERRLLWVALAFGIALCSLVQFFLKRRRRRNDDWRC